MTRQSSSGKLDFRRRTNCASKGICFIASRYHLLGFVQNAGRDEIAMLGFSFVSNVGLAFAFAVSVHATLLSLPILRQSRTLVQTTARFEICKRLLSSKWIILAVNGLQKAALVDRQKEKEKPHLASTPEQGKANLGLERRARALHMLLLHLHGPCRRR